MDIIMITCFLSTILSWGVAIDIDAMDWSLVTTWLTFIFCIPGFIITLGMMSPLLVLCGIGHILNLAGKKIYDSI